MLDDEGTWAFFHDFLVPTLDRAFALAEMDRLTQAIAKDLYLDVMGRGIELLNEKTGVLEQRFATGLYCFE
jgi:hypothetical protein